jgi:class 3 adenylate cyclase
MSPKNKFGNIPMGLRSKLMIMFLTISICSMVAIASISYQSGQKNLTERIYSQLTSIRSGKTAQIEGYFQNIRSQIETLSTDLMIVNAMKEFKQAYNQLNNQKLTPDMEEKLNNYYQREYLPKLNQSENGQPVLEQFKPNTITAKYLQYQFILNNPSTMERKQLLDNPGDNTEYSKIHAQYQPILRDLSQKFGYHNMYLIDTDTGNIVYSIFKETDLGTNLYNGPYKKSNLAQVVNAVVEAKKQNFAQIVDFKPYQPSLGAPVAFICAPIFYQSKLIGVLAFQLAADKINEVMTGNRKWLDEGLGYTGESYIVGADYTMRSPSRLLLENPDAYFKFLDNMGVNPQVITHIKNYQTSILMQPVKTIASQEALAGKQGTKIDKNYLDIPVISSYSPLKIPGLDWVIISEVYRQEAYYPIYSLQRSVLISAAIIIVITTIAAMVLSYVFIKPINILIHNARKITSGQIDTIINLNSSDEFGELAEAFNEMVGSLHSQTTLVQEKNRENENLLLSIFPDSVAKRLKKGDKDIVDQAENVTVLISDITGFTKLYESMEVNQVLTILNDIVSAFDQATEKYGVEKVKTIGDNYIAVCGLSVPRLDHAKRMLDFALEMRTIIRKFNYEKGFDLDISIVINSGDVIAGIVGRKKFSYDVWGHAVNTANYIFSKIENPPGSILVADNVHKELQDIYEFEKFAEMPYKHQQKLTIWQVKKP